MSLISKICVTLLGGTRNERVMRSRMKFVVERVNPLDPAIRALSDEQLLQKSLALRQKRQDGAGRESIKAEAFAVIREASRRARNHRQFDVQLAAALILDEGWIAEEATGEGKTIACYPAIYMAWLDGMKSHVVTVNDYLVQRDAEFAQPIFALLGMTVGFIRSEMPSYGPDSQIRRNAYACDVTYGTNSEFGFDYLRDNMKLSTADQVQGRLDFAIVDEVDNILIDEARTPLIISGPSHGGTDQFRQADTVTREIVSRNRTWDRANQRVEGLKRSIKSLEGELSKGKAESVQRKLKQAEEDLDKAETELADMTRLYEVELDHKSAHLTEAGVAVAQDIAGIGSFYVGANMEWPHLMEQSLRAHLVYEKDKDYVVQNGTVLIVDEFTGRILEGRQWSDGLHQAVEAKERVEIKEENQTLGTITIQNYFRMYKKLAGMTGTAMTEAGEFLKIYKLDVASVPTHRPVNRIDFDDYIYAEEAPKYEAIVEEIRKYSRDLKRPVLVGTTSVEKSELLSQMLTRSYGIDHQVLNARPENAAREADIVTEAGMLRPIKPGDKEMVGTVTIATNMAGRGTDIKLGPGVVWQHCKVPSAAKLAELGASAEELFPEGTTKCCIHCQQYNAATGCAHCFKTKLDSAFPARGRKDCTREVPCGLHIVGTERHEARRIDNQLRGRSGRQGDPGSSRFFLSLRDDLMAVFAGPWTLKVLGWLGLTGAEHIEHPRISKGVSGAQKKVEDRNFETRKNLLEYDEVMDHQRRSFYSQRQSVLKGAALSETVLDMVRESIDQAVGSYLDGKYVRRCIAEWARLELQTAVRDEQISAASADDVESLEARLRELAKEEAAGAISMTLGEYMSDDVPSEEWDLRGLGAWAMSRFGVNFSQNQLRKMSPDEVDKALNEAAAERIDKTDLTAAGRFLAQDFDRKSLADWARNKFAIEISASDLSGGAEEVAKKLIEQVEALYRRREIEYPVEHAMEMTIAQAGMDNVYALTSLADWANRKYEAKFTADDFRALKPEQIHAQLLELSREWMTGGKLEETIRRNLGADPSAEKAAEFAKARFDTEMNPADFDGDVAGRLVEAGRRFLRREMTELERFVLLQIYDSTWKDHLLAMDHLKGGIGLRSYAEQDPRVAYKREGAGLFQEMLASVREKVTDMIFKVRLAGAGQMQNVYQISSMVHEQLSGYDNLAKDMDEQRAAAGEAQKIQTIVRNQPKVGRNDPCPCGSGKKYKKCCGVGR